MTLTDYNRRTMGDVRDHVEPVAEEVCGIWPCPFVWGRSSGTSGEHPLGLALDFSVLAYGGGVDNPGPADMDKGEDIASYLWANRHRLNVWYVIWDRGIISTNPDSYAYNRWTPYVGRNPHTDHVHVSHYPDRTYQPPDDDFTEDPDMLTPESLDRLAERLEAHMTQRTHARVNDRDKDRFGYRQNLFQVGALAADGSVKGRENAIRLVRLEAKLDVLTAFVLDRELTDAELDAIEARVENVLDNAGILEAPEVGTVEGGGSDGPTQH